MKYFYNKNGVCYEFIRPYRRTCQLHGDFIEMLVEGHRIRKSGKPSNCSSLVPISNLSKENLDWLCLEYPELKEGL